MRAVHRTSVSLDVPDTPMVADSVGYCVIVKFGVVVAMSICSKNDSGPANCCDCCTRRRATADPMARSVFCRLQGLVLL